MKIKKVIAIYLILIFIICSLSNIAFAETITLDQIVDEFNSDSMDIIHDNNVCSAVAIKEDDKIIITISCQSCDTDHILEWTLNDNILSSTTNTSLLLLDYNDHYCVDLWCYIVFTIDIIGKLHGYESGYFWNKIWNKNVYNTEEYILKNDGFEIEVMGLYEDQIVEVNIDLSKEFSPLAEEQTNELEKIEVTTKPTKTKYTEGEIFDKTGMWVIATYSDGTTKTVTDYTISPLGQLQTSNNKITISYTEDGITKTADLEITVEKSSNTNTNISTNTGTGTNNSGTSVITQKDDTILSKELPKAGRTVISAVMVILITSAVIWYVRYKKVNV